MIDWESLYIKLLVEKQGTSGERHHVKPRYEGGTDELVEVYFIMQLFI